MASTQSYPLSDFLNGKGTVNFDDFVRDARASGLDPAKWLKEKHAGKVETEVNDSGVLVIRKAS